MVQSSKWEKFKQALQKYGGIVLARYEYHGTGGLSYIAVVEYPDINTLRKAHRDLDGEHWWRESRLQKFWDKIK
jgi:uncharacterized protein (DUF1330 family)